MATVPHVISGLGLKTFQADGFLLTRVYVLCFSVDCLLGNPANRQSTEKHNMYQFLYIYNIPLDDGLQACQKHVEVDWRNKLRINNASRWFSLHGCIEMHGQQNKTKIRINIDSEIWRGYISLYTRIRMWLYRLNKFRYFVTEKCPDLFFSVLNLQFVYIAKLFTATVKVHRVFSLVCPVTQCFAV